MSSDLSRLFKRAVLKTVINEGVPAKLGKADGATIFYVDDAGTHHKDKVWARIGAGTAPAEAVVRCVNVPQTLNLPVIVADREGVLTVIRTDTSRAVEWADGQLIDVAPHNWTHDRYGSDALYITGLSFLPLAAYPSDPPDLTVTVEQCFYRYQNTHKVFELTISDSLSAYRPVDVAVTHYIILALDRSTNALTVIDGNDVSGGNRALPSASTVLATSGIRSEHFPICAIRFYNGQTQIMPRDIFMDLRLWAGESSASGSGSSGSAAVRGPDTSTDHAIARWDGTDGTLLQDSYPTIDDSGNLDMDGNELRDYSHQMIEANTGAAYEIDWAAAGIFELTLTDDATFTFVNESAGRAVTLILIQDGVGGRTVTWPGAVEWPNDVEPVLFSGVGDADTITLICRNDGSTVSGFAASDVRTNQGNTFTVGNQIIQTDPDTLTAFQVFDADGGVPVLSVDTINERVGIGVAAPGAQLQVDTSGPTVIGQIIKLDPSQSENAFEVQKSDGAVLINAKADGAFEVFGRASFGSAGSTAVDRTVEIDDTYTNTAGSRYTIFSRLTAAPNAPSSASYFSNRFTTRYSKSHNLTGALYGVDAEVDVTSGQTPAITTLNTMKLSLDAEDSVTTWALLADFLMPYVDTGSITNSIGLRFRAAVIGAGSITNQTAIQIADISGATTLNYALYTGLGDVRFGDEVVIASPTANALTIGAGTAGIDYTLTFDGETNDGVLTWMEDEDWFNFLDTVKTSAGRIKSTTRIDDGDSPYTTLNTDDVIFADTDGGVITVNLQAGVDGRRLRIINCGSSGNDVTIDGDGAETIRGELTQTLADEEILILVFETTEEWY